MYNMELTIGTCTFRLEIVILIVIVFWITVGHLLCSCCRVNLLEGLATQVLIAKKKNDEKAAEEEEETSTTEGFRNTNRTTTGSVFAEAQSPDYIMDPSTWSSQSLAYSAGSTPSQGVKDLWNRPKQPIPLPENQLDMFATTPFKPECCPNAYSSSTGCACMTNNQYNYLKSRGGNNVPYSEY